MLSIKKVVCCTGFVLVAAGAFGDGVPAGTVADIEERTRPFGELCLEGEDCGGEQAPAPLVAQGRNGREIYTEYCQVCHQGGLNNAPIIGDADAWKPRLAKGMDELLRNTKEGFNLMPPTGNCATCTDAEFRAAIEHLSGATGDG